MHTYVLDTDNIHGNLFTITVEGNVFVAALDATTYQATVQQYNISTNDSTVSIASLSERGSGDNRALSADRQLIYDVLHNHAYIAMDTNVLIVNLNTSNPPYLSYETLDIGHIPTAVKAFTLNAGDPFVAVTYTTAGDREYLRRFRKYDNRVWGYYGEPVLVVTPFWYNVSRISNTLIYKAADSLSTFVDTVWAAVAEEWYIYTVDLVDGTTRTFSTPEPCDNIQRLVHSEHRQRMLVQCAEATVFFDSKQKEFYKLWSEVIGTVSIAASGKYGAVVDTAGTGLTVLHLHGDYQATSVDVQGTIRNLLFVDTGTKNLHYLCYVEQVNEVFAVKCLNIEQLNSTQNHALLFQGVTDIAPTLYSHRNLLTVKHFAVDDCPLLQVFDMITLTNTHNVTNVNPALITFKPLPLSPTKNATDSTTTTPSLTPNNRTNYTHTPATMPTTVTVTTDQHTVELERAQGKYQTLLLTTTIVASLFCIALLAMVIVFAIMLHHSRAHSDRSVEHKIEQPVLTDVKQTGL